MSSHYPYLTPLMTMPNPHPPSGLFHFPHFHFCQSPEATQRGRSFLAESLYIYSNMFYVFLIIAAVAYGPKSLFILPVLIYIPIYILSFNWRPSLTCEYKEAITEE